MPSATQATLGTSRKRPIEKLFSALGVTALDTPTDNTMLSSTRPVASVATIGGMPMPRMSAEVHGPVASPTPIAASRPSGMLFVLAATSIPANPARVITPGIERSTLPLPAVIRNI